MMTSCWVHVWGESQSLGNITYLEYYLKLHDLINMRVEATRRAKVVATHFIAPYNFHEHINVRVIGHQVIIDTMDNKGQVQSIECPNHSG
jgi:hypothetical protein